MMKYPASSSPSDPPTHPSTCTTHLPHRPIYTTSSTHPFTSNRPLTAHSLIYLTPTTHLTPTNPSTSDPPTHLLHTHPPIYLLPTHSPIYLTSTSPSTFHLPIHPSTLHLPTHPPYTHPPIYPPTTHSPSASQPSVHLPHTYPFTHLPHTYPFIRLSLTHPFAFNPPTHSPIYLHLPTHLMLQLLRLASVSSMMVMEDRTSMETRLGWFFWISLYILHRKCATATMLSSTMEIHMTLAM